LSVSPCAFSAAQASIKSAGICRVASQERSVSRPQAFQERRHPKSAGICKSASISSAGISRAQQALKSASISGSARQERRHPKTQAFKSVAPRAGISRAQAFQDRRHFKSAGIQERRHSSTGISRAQVSRAQAVQERSRDIKSTGISKSRMSRCSIAFHQERRHPRAQAVQARQERSVQERRHFKSAFKSAGILKSAGSSLAASQERSTYAGITAGIPRASRAQFKTQALGSAFQERRHPGAQVLQERKQTKSADISRAQSRAQASQERAFQEHRHLKSAASQERKHSKSAGIKSAGISRAQVLQDRRHSQGASSAFQAAGIFLSAGISKRTSQERRHFKSAEGISQAFQERVIKTL
jgi:hypothetical protein